MNSHNKHNENTPDKRQADASQLSEEQQALLTAEALGQLEPGSADAAEAAKIRSGQHRRAACLRLHLPAAAAGHSGV